MTGYSGETLTSRDSPMHPSTTPVTTSEQLVPNPGRPCRTRNTTSARPAIGDVGGDRSACHLPMEGGSPLRCVSGHLAPLTAHQVASLLDRLATPRMPSQSLPPNQTPDLPIRPTGSRLVIDTPILRVLEAMSADLDRLRRLEPSSGARHALEEYYERLNVALREALDAEAWVSTEEAARLRDCTTAAITALCRKGKLVCQKRGGVWEIHKDSVLADTRRPRTD